LSCQVFKDFNSGTTVFGRGALENYTWKCVGLEQGRHFYLLVMELKSPARMTVSGSAILIDQGQNDNMDAIVNY
jgi:hypothetical protein